MHAALLLASALILSVHLGCATKRSPQPEVADAQTAALAKSAEWYKKKVYRLAEAEARKAGDSVEARYALFQSLVAQAEYEAKAAEAETTARGLLTGAPADNDQARSAQRFLDQRHEQRKSPLAAFQTALKDKSEEARALRQAKVLSATEKVAGAVGSANVELEFENPYTKKVENAMVTLAFKPQQQEGWKIDWDSSDLRPVAALFGDPKHNFSERGVEGIVSFSATFASWEASLQLKPAEGVVPRPPSPPGPTRYRPPTSQTPAPPRYSIYRATKVGIVADKEPENSVFPNGGFLMVMDRRFRLASGLGVGNTVGDFLKSYRFVEPKLPQETSCAMAFYMRKSFGHEGIVKADGAVLKLNGMEVKPLAGGANLILYVHEYNLGRPLERLEKLPVYGMSFVRSSEP